MSRTRIIKQRQQHHALIFLPFQVQLMQQKSCQCLEPLDEVVPVGAMAAMLVGMVAMAMVEVRKEAMAVAIEIMIQHGGGNIVAAMPIPTTTKPVAAGASHVR